MTAVPRSGTRAATPAHRTWIPRQHGAWAMLLLPVLLGVAASVPAAWQVAVGGAALAAYLASATIQAWSRSRRPPAYRAPIIVYTGIAVVLGALLLVAFPPLALCALVLVPTGLLVFRGAQPGTRRDLVNSLAQVAQSLVLVPATAYVSGTFDVPVVVAYTLVAAGYQLGVVLVVRSVLRERGNTGFLLLSVGFHAALVVAAIVWLPAAYVVVAVGLLARAIALPIVQARRAGGPKPLKPVHVGIVEIVASVSVAVVSFVAPI
jgi:hypothetical protein